MEERRNAPNRIKADVQVDYLGTHVVLYHRVLNLSIGGICIESPSVEAVGKVVRLSLNFPDLHRSGRRFPSNRQYPPSFRKSNTANLMPEI